MGPATLESSGSSLEIETLDPIPDRLNQNLHFNQSLGWLVHMHGSLGSIALENLKEPKPFSLWSRLSVNMQGPNLALPKEHKTRDRLCVLKSHIDGRNNCSAPESLVGGMAEAT